MTSTMSSALVDHMDEHGGLHLPPELGLALLTWVEECEEQLYHSMAHFESLEGIMTQMRVRAQAVAKTTGGEV